MFRKLLDKILRRERDQRSQWGRFIDALDQADREREGRLWDDWQLLEKIEALGRG